MKRRLTRAEAARLVGISEATIRRADRDDKIEPYTNAQGFTSYEPGDLAIFALKRSPLRATPGQIAAAVFARFEQGHNAAAIVSEFGLSPELVSSLRADLIVMKNHGGHTRSSGASTPPTRRRSRNDTSHYDERGAASFAYFEADAPLSEVVVALHLSPAEVNALQAQWFRLKDDDTGMT